MTAVSKFNKKKIAIAEKLAALIRVADITELNLINKKKSRRINSNKYLNKNFFIYNFIYNIYYFYTF